MSRRATQPAPRQISGPWGRRSVVGSSSSVWETPDGLSAELARLDAEFSAFQQEIKDNVLGRGFPDHVDDSLRPLVELYLRSWIPLILRWQGFYRENKGWTGKPWQWTHAEEVARNAAQLSEIRSSARQLMGAAPTSLTSPTPPTPPTQMLSPTSTPSQPWAPPSPPSPDPARVTARETSPPADGIGHAGVAIAAVGALAIVVALVGGRS